MKSKRLANMMVFAMCITLGCALALATGCSGASSSGTSGSAAADSSTSSADAASSATGLRKADAIGPYASGIHHATLTVEGYDPVVIELNADAAPASVVNFCTLANDGYYDGLTFYRFVEGFCMQGGTLGNSASGNDTTLDAIVGEFSTNGYDNELADNFKKGTVAMARSSDPNSARSTFFITLDSSQGVSLSLDGRYAAFGTIDEAGMKTIDAIVEDFMPNVDDPRTGAISDESKQAKITSIKIED